jgi:hypothetical protein
LPNNFGYMRNKWHFRNILEELVALRELEEQQIPTI